MYVYGKKSKAGARPGAAGGIQALFFVDKMTAMQ